MEEGTDVTNYKCLEGTAAGIVVVEREEVGGNGLKGCKEGAAGLRTEDVEVLKNVFRTVAAFYLGGI